MSNDGGTEITSLQIIKIEELKFIFDFDLFVKIIEQNEKTAKLPVSVIIINGALRTGKSFFCNLMVRYLLNLEGLEQTDTLKDYFVSRRSSGVQTRGIWVLNKIFIHNGMAIVLMDTQGIFDQELNQTMTTALMSLSTIISSYQIYNLDKRIQEDHLCYISYFSAYSSLLSNIHNTKIGQTLCILVRDWQNYANNTDIKNCEIETENYRKEFMDNVKDTNKIETRKKIYDTYDNVVVRLCPYPGYTVTEGHFTGNLSEVRDDFKMHIEYIISEILNNVQPKRISSSQKLLCDELPAYIKEYVVLYENVKVSLPEALNILETTEKICQDNAKNKTVYFYKERMMARIKNNPISKDEIDELHKKYSDDAQEFLNEMYIMGKEEDIEKVKIHTLNCINDEYQQFLLMACENNAMIVALNGIFDIIKNINNYQIDADSVKNGFVILCFAYVFTMILPFGSEFLATIIKYIGCIFIGMLVCLYAKNQDNNLLQNDPVSNLEVLN
jgi:atlastin